MFLLILAISTQVTRHTMRSLDTQSGTIHPQPTYYDILGVPLNASRSDIEDAYQKHALLYDSEEMQGRDYFEQKEHRLQFTRIATIHPLLLGPERCLYNSEVMNVPWEHYKACLERETKIHMREFRIREREDSRREREGREARRVQWLVREFDTAQIRAMTQDMFDRGLFAEGGLIDPAMSPQELADRLTYSCY